MISIETFLMGLMVVSVLTSLATEAIKKVFVENGVNCRSNTVAGVISAVLSIGIGVSHVIVNCLDFNAQTITCIIALCFMSWLCAMLGYDKVIQAIGQFNTTKSKEE